MQINKPLHVIFDIANAPLTWDIIQALGIATVQAKRGGFKGFHAHIVTAEGNWRMATPKDKALTEQQKLMRVSTIHSVAPRIAKDCVGYTVWNSREECQKFFNNKDVSAAQANYMLPNLFRMAKSDELEFLQPRKEWLDLVKQWYPEPPVVITLRYSSTESNRNSNFELWKEIEDYIGLYTSYKTSVVCIPDTEYSLTKLGYAYFGDIEKNNNKYDIYANGFEKLISVNLELRHALMSYAKVNLSDSGGPSLLPWYTEGAKAVNFWQCDKDRANHLSIADEDHLVRTCMLLGVDYKGQFPNSDANRYFVWKENLTVDDVMEEVVKFI